ncbi:MAG: DNA mismatch repair protein MutS [Methanomicrobiales archaeon]|nr:DNA mismatch repair protein MutS [Methanomicrobiales archaeon]
MSDPKALKEDREKEVKGKPGRITPAMQQFYDAKRQYPDCVIFFRMGDFYETFCEDAQICARVLDITLTTRGRMPDGQDIPLAGVPYHAVDTYLSRMITRGYKVAICEQVEDPKKAKGIVKRAVVRVVTPGTVIDAALLSTEQARYLMAVFIDPKKRRVGLSFIDISTGDFLFTEIASPDMHDIIRSEAARYAPTECIIPAGSGEDLARFIHQFVPLVSFQDSSIFTRTSAEELLCRQFNIAESDDLTCFGYPAGTIAAGAALAYAQKTQFDSLSHIRSLNRSDTSSHLVLDAVTLRNLEVLQNIRDRTEEGTLVATIDMTLTPMGRRLLRKRIAAPLLFPDDINRRLDAVSYFIDRSGKRTEIRSHIQRFPDLERIAGRISYGNASPRDLVTLISAIESVENLKKLLAGENDLPEEISVALSGIRDVTGLTDLIRRAIVEDPPVLVRKGGVIRDGYHEELDRLRMISRNGKQWIVDLEQKEKERTGIKSLKIKYNAVFGYYIEITRANLASVPPDYERRQTTANGERYTVPALREMESQIATADERLLGLEEEIFRDILEHAGREIATLQDIAQAIGKIDLYAGLAEIALKYQYVRPELVDEPNLLIREGRHPVVESSLRGGFVPNDAELSAGSDQILIITGANMAGKSTYMRSVALTVILAQTGSFVPAAYAKVGVADRIFTRVGAFDDLASGQSTFMVEMMELATILNHATDKSLVILDEIGRGTSTLDGYCIAKAVLEHLHGRRSKGPRCLFATHFHEIVGIEADLKRVRNCHFAVKETDKDVIFLRKLVPGATDRSYGIHVAQLAGVPVSVVERSEELMKRIISGEDLMGGGVKRYTQMILLDSGLQPQESAGSDLLLEEIRSINVNGITPLEALGILSNLQEKARKNE